jgi:hypothetical protein
VRWNQFQKVDGGGDKLWNVQHRRSSHFYRHKNEESTIRNPYILCFNIPARCDPSKLKEMQLFHVTQ